MNEHRFFFSTEEKRAALRAEAQSWIGTPFFPHGRVKRAGVDCVQLAAALYIATGFLSAFEPGAYTMDGGRHAGISKVVEWVDKSRKFELQDSQPVAGDLLCFAVGKSKVAWHVGVMLDDKNFVHVLMTRTVVFCGINDMKILSLTAVYRPLSTLNSHLSI